MTCAEETAGSRMHQVKEMILTSEILLHGVLFFIRVRWFNDNKLKSEYCPLKFSILQNTYRSLLCSLLEFFHDESRRIYFSLIRKWCPRYLFFRPHRFVPCARLCSPCRPRCHKRIFLHQQFRLPPNPN